MTAVWSPASWASQRPLPNSGSTGYWTSSGCIWVERTRCPPGGASERLPAGRPQGTQGGGKDGLVGGGGVQRFNRYVPCRHIGVTGRPGGGGPRHNPV